MSCRPTELSSATTVEDLGISLAEVLGYIVVLPLNMYSGGFAIPPGELCTTGLNMPSALAGKGFGSRRLSGLEAMLTPKAVK